MILLISFQKMLLKTNVNEEIVKLGLATVPKPAVPPDFEHCDISRTILDNLRTLELKARKDKVGQWSEGKTEQQKKGVIKWLWRKIRGG